MRFFTSSGCSRMSKPATVAVPLVGVKKQVSMRIVVVLPAPLGPRKPTIWPFCTSNEIWSTAVVCAYFFVSALTLIIRILFETDAYETVKVPQPQVDIARHNLMNLAASCQSFPRSGQARARPLNMVAGKSGHTSVLHFRRKEGKKGKQVAHALACGSSPEKWSIFEPPDPRE